MAVVTICSDFGTPKYTVCPCFYCSPSICHEVMGPDTMIFSSVQFSSSVVSDSLRRHEPQHARPPCPSPTPWVHPNPCPLSQWCHPAISSSVIPFSSCLQSLQTSESFPMNQLFTWGGQSIGVSGSASVLSMNTQDWSPLGWTGWTSLQSKGLSRVFSNTTVQKNQFFSAQLSSQSNSLIHTWPLELERLKKIFFIFDFRKFDYDMLYLHSVFFLFIVTGVYWVYLILVNNFHKTW